MAKIKLTAIPAARQKVQNEWKIGNNQTDTIVYDPSDFDGEDFQLWCFKQGVLVDVQSEIGPFKRIVFIAVLS